MRADDTLDDGQPGAENPGDTAMNQTGTQSDAKPVYPVLPPDIEERWTGLRAGRRSRAGYRGGRRRR